MTPSPPPLSWSIKHFSELSAAEFHAIAQLRIDVFVVEQECPYSELDGKDPECFHLAGRDANGALWATARIAPPGHIYPYPSIGRVATAAAARGKGYGVELMNVALSFCRDRFPNSPIKIAAQKYLEKFYGDLGFKTISVVYPWDGIDHVDMIKEWQIQI